jgi:hypothetical protein
MAHGEMALLLIRHVLALASDAVVFGLELQPFERAEAFVFELCGGDVPDDIVFVFRLGPVLPKIGLMEPDVGSTVRMGAKAGTSSSWTSTYLPTVMAFMELRCFPSMVTGPLLLAPLRRAVSARRCFCSAVRTFFMTVTP